jgi:hypothetical protein
LKTRDIKTSRKNIEEFFSGRIMTNSNREKTERINDPNGTGSAASSATIVPKFDWWKFGMTTPGKRKTTNGGDFGRRS